MRRPPVARDPNAFKIPASELLSTSLSKQTPTIDVDPLDALIEEHVEKASKAKKTQFELEEEQNRRKILRSSEDPGDIVEVLADLEADQLDETAGLAGFRHQNESFETIERSLLSSGTLADLLTESDEGDTLPDDTEGPSIEGRSQNSSHHGAIPTESSHRGERGLIPVSPPPDTQEATPEPLWRWSQQRRTAAAMTALGVSADQIADHLGVPFDDVLRWRVTPTFQQYVADFAERAPFEAYSMLRSHSVFFARQLIAIAKGGTKDHRVRLQAAMRGLEIAGVDEKTFSRIAAGQHGRSESGDLAEVLSFLEGEARVVDESDPTQALSTATNYRQDQPPATDKVWLIEDPDANPLPPLDLLTLALETTNHPFGKALATRARGGGSYALQFLSSENQLEERGGRHDGSGDGPDSDAGREQQRTRYPELATALPTPETLIAR